MDETVETAHQRVYLVLEIRRDPLPVEVLVDSGRDFLGMGQPEEIQESGAPLVFDDILGDLEQQLKIRPLGLLRLPGLSDALGQGTGDCSQEVQERGLKAGVELDEKGRLVSPRLGTFRQDRDRKPEEFLDFFGSSLDETSRLTILFPGAPHVAHELTTDQTGLSGTVFLLEERLPVDEGLQLLSRLKVGNLFGGNIDGRTTLGIPTLAAPAAPNPKAPKTPKFNLTILV
jgi:hypothetical protein